MAIASEKINTREKANAKEYPLNAMGIWAPLVGWLVPGAGHLIQKKWVRGLLLMISVFSMFFFGLMMQGKVYTPNTGDVLEMLGFVGDIGSGGLYMLSRTMDWGQGAINIAAADYGTKFIIVAGLLNIIAAVDAHQIAIGKKS
ncbi:MAG TPA: DUF6677 family protein [Terriglobales bacterium]|jgi:hypothetical protein|nr:DUF6677 family protein [Terriglobales bacterium]